MEFKNIREYRNYILIIILALFSIFVLWIRLLPLMTAGNTDILNLAGSDDPLYNLRLVELVIKNYPVYPNFDAMTLFPTGQLTAWGPLLTLISATIVMIAGSAATRPGIITVSLMVPPIMAAIMVPVVFLLVRKVSDWKSGIVAAGFIAVVSGQYFFRSLYGYFDHHIAEVLFSTIFILTYVICMWWGKEHPADLTNIETLKKPVIFAIIAGVAYILGLFTMPTMILFAMIIGIFTVIQFVWDFYRKISSDYLLVTNVVTFGFATIAFFIVGVQRPGLQLNFYTITHPVAYILLILGTVFLYVLARYLKGKKFYYYPASLLGLVILVLVLFMVIAPTFYGTFVSGMVEFFGQNPYYLTIQEARSWTLVEAWNTFNYGLILTIGGFFVLLYRSWKEERPDQHVILIWSVIVLIAAWQHIRYEYYLAANVAILAGLCVGYVFNMGWKDLVLLARPSGRNEKSKDTPANAPAPAQKGKKAPQKSKGAVKKGPNYIRIGLVGLVILFSILFVAASLPSEYYIATSGGLRMQPDWKESLEWMGVHTPDPGVDYYKIYNNATFQYPPQAYGVMSWWDYGHLITYIAKRIPNANPFQAGVAGPNGSAAYFMSRSEPDANQILKNDGTRYVVTDIEMDTTKFWAMATWYNTTIGVTPYQRTYLIPDPNNQGQYGPVTLYDEPYYQTMVSRLHNFDGSMTDPTTAFYVEYSDPSITTVPYPVVTGAKNMNVSDALSLAKQYNNQAINGKHAEVLNMAPFLPLSQVPALQHYRLVHESPNNAYSSSPPDTKYVKVFEFVPGAVIRGEGIIEVPVVTDTGRQFTYRQASTNGSFVVPYSTIGNPYDVKTTGKYHIIGTNQQFDVPEDAVMQGKQIN
jgi:dolichyl-phosphooligosaccharide-protein glycotransferase